MDYIDIGPSPAEEDCVQVGVENYRERAQVEMGRYIHAIRDTVGVEPPGARLRIKWFPHDFGTYGSVVVEYYDDEGMEYAFRAEREAPERWPTKVAVG